AWKLHVRQAVAVRREEHLVVADEPLDGLEALADLQPQPGVGEGDSPVDRILLEQLDARLRTTALEDEVARERLVVCEEVLLDRLSLVTEAEDELAMAPVGVVAHDVPENRAVADSSHRLGYPLGLLAHPDAEAAAEDHDLQLAHRRRASPGSSPGA